jgi:hypothetical protein
LNHENKYSSSPSDCHLLFYLYSAPFPQEGYRSICDTIS